MNKIHEAMLIMAQEKPAPTIYDLQEKADKIEKETEYANAWEVLSGEFKNPNDSKILSKIKEKFSADKQKYASKLSPNLVNEFDSIIAKEINDQVYFKHPLSASMALAMVDGNYNKIQSILQNALEEVTGPTLKSTKTDSIDGSWTVSFWKKLIQGLYKRALNQQNIARANLDSANTDMQKKKFGIILKSKENYVAYIQNLGAALDRVSKNKAPSDRLSDSLLGSSSESRSERGGRRSRSDVARGYESDYEGEDRSSQEERYKTFPFEKGNDSIRIKKLLKSYGLAGSYPLLMNDKASEILSYKIWAGSWDKEINKALTETDLSQYERAQYVHELRKAIVEMRQKYIEYMNSKDSDPSEGQLKLFAQLISSLDVVKKSFPVANTPSVESEMSTRK